MQAKNVIALGAVVVLLWALTALSAGGPSDEKSAFVLPTPTSERLESIDAGRRGQIDRNIAQNMAPPRPLPPARAAQTGKTETRIENQLHSAREAAGQSATAGPLGANADAGRAPSQQSRPGLPSSPRATQSQTEIQARASDSGIRNAMIASLDEALEDRQHMARQRTAEAWTARVYAALEKTLQAVAAQTAEETSKGALTGLPETRPEDRQDSAPSAVMAGPERGGSDDVNGVLAEQAANNEAIAAAEAERVAKKSADAAAEAILADRLRSAREAMAQRTATDLARGRREEADRIVADLNATLQANAAAAAAERVRIAQIAADNKASAIEQARNSAVIAREDALLDNRQHTSRESMARLTTDELALGRRKEAERIVADLDKTVQARVAAAAAQRARVAQIAAESQATALAQANANVVMARQDALLDDRQHSSREIMARRTTAELQQSRREEADRIVVDLDKTLQARVAAAAAERARVAQIDSETRTTAALAANDDATGKVKSADVGKTEFRIESLLHAARLRVARLTSSGGSDLQKPGFAREPAKQLSQARAAQHLPQPGTNGVDYLTRRTAALTSGAAGQNGSLESGKAPRALVPSSASSVASAGLAVSVRRRCPSILASEGEYDDDLVSLCRTWADWR
jgi:hypothetical protein